MSDLIEMTSDRIINGAIEYMPNKTKGERPEVVRVPLNIRQFISCRSGISDLNFNFAHGKQRRML